MKWMSLLLSLIALKACSGDAAAPKITLKPNSNTFVAGDTLRVKLKHKKELVWDKLEYFLNDTPIALPYVFGKEKLGDHRLRAVATLNGQAIEGQRSIRLLNAQAPALWTYTILNEYPHDTEAYTQGLEFDGETLYESTGLKGKSSLRKVNYKTGELLENIPLDASYFGEGLTLLKDKIYQLTWQENTAFVYDKTSLKMETSFSYDQSKEGWGLCNDGSVVYKTDGTEKLWKLDPATFTENGYVDIVTHNKLISKINELEYANGLIYANTYQFNKEVVLIIKPATGQVVGVVDFSGLKEQVTQHTQLDVFNGIAYHPKRNSFFVTGKYWDKLFEVEIVRKQ